MGYHWQLGEAVVVEKPPPELRCILLCSYKQTQVLQAVSMQNGKCRGDYFPRRNHRIARLAGATQQALTMGSPRQRSCCAAPALAKLCARVKSCEPWTRGEKQ